MLQERIQSNLLSARKAKRQCEKSILSVLLGEIQNLQFSSNQRGQVTDKQIVRIIRSLVKSNQETLGHLSPGMDMFSRLYLENIVLNDLLPPTWTKEQIVEWLEKNHGNLIWQQKHEGKAIGIAMKLLNSTDDYLVEGDDVAWAVREIMRGEDT